MHKKCPRRSRGPWAPKQGNQVFPDLLEFYHPVYHLFDSLPNVCFFVKNRLGQFVHGNHAFLQMFGMHRLEEILGKTDFDFAPRELASGFVKDDRWVMKSGKPLVNRVELVPSRDDSIRWHLTSKVPLRDANGEVIGIAGFTRDMLKESVALQRSGAFTPVIDYIRRNQAHAITLKEMARLVHLSPSQFERRFKTDFGITPVQYLTKERVGRACQLLVRSRDKITEIALACGFYDHSHFIRQFRRIVGMTPGAFRRSRV